MSDPYLGEIRMFAGNFAPVGWAFCAGQLMSISQNEALFTLLGTFYGGDGVQTFALPDLRGRVPIHQGQGQGLSSYIIGQIAGVEQVTLTSNNLPTHGHFAVASTNAADATSPSNTFVAVAGTPSTPYVTGVAAGALTPVAIAPTGGSIPHENLMPFLCVSFIIAIEGIFPSQN